MADLQVGESILSMDPAGNAVFSEVLMFMDRASDKRREFVRLLTDGGASLTVTPAHLLLVWHPDQSITKYRFADQIEEGHQLLVNVNGTLMPQRVVRITAELQMGVYAPLTALGTVVVDSVAASCYALVDSQDIAHWSFAPVRAMNSVLHWFGAGAGSSRGSPVKSLQHGVHWYASALYTVKDYFLPSDWLYQT